MPTITLACRRHVLYIVTMKPATRDELYEGRKVLYVPTHAHGDVMHNDCEWGEVVRLSNNEASVFIKYRSPTGFTVPQSTYIQDVYIDENKIERSMPTIDRGEQN